MAEDRNKKDQHDTCDPTDPQKTFTSSKEVKPLKKKTRKKQAAKKKPEEKPADGVKTDTVTEKKEEEAKAKEEAETETKKKAEEEAKEKTENKKAKKPELEIDRAAFFSHVRSNIFGGRLRQIQVDGMEGILDAFMVHGDGEATTLAYALATAYHEVGLNMSPVREGFREDDAAARRYVRKLARKRGPNSGVAKYAVVINGIMYYGRGYSQLTFDFNYKKAGDEIGIDLLSNPDRALEPKIAAMVLFKGLLNGWWNSKGKGLRHYLDANDPIGARWTVNRQDKAEEIAITYNRFLNSVKASV